MGEIMKKRKDSSNWKSVLIVALIFISVGTLTYIVHTKIPKKILKKTNTDITEKFEDQEGKTIEITANKIVSATGFAGASNYKFYLKEETLFFLNIANKNNKEEIIATGVKDLYLENKEVTAELFENGKIVKENNYITYKK